MSSTFIERKKINPNTNKKGFPLLAAEQFERLILSHNVEFRGGFYMNTVVPTGEAKEVYVPDSREVFCNTCKAMAILVLPSASSDFIKELEAIEAELLELEKSFLMASSVEEDVILGESFYEKEEDKILLEQYSNKKVKIYQKLFYSLAALFKKHRYWEKSSSDD